MAIDLAAYWFVGHITAKVFVSDPDKKMFHVETQNTSGLISDDDQTGMLAQWQLIADANGIWEVIDIFPGNKFTYLPGYSYPWGTRSMSVGQKIAKSTGWRDNYGQVRWGYAITTLTAQLPTYSTPAGVFNDVVVIDSLQYWCKQAAPLCGGLNLTHSVFYLAKGAGTIEEDWILPNGGLTALKLQSCFEGATS